MNLLRIVAISLLAGSGSAEASVQLNFKDFNPAGDGKTDETQALRNCFETLQKAGGGTLVIPPGDYAVAGPKSIPLCSNSHISATGARFLLPETLGDKAMIVLFAGQDIEHFSWEGGEFVGHCFDHKRPPNTWEPNANTRMISITTSPDGRTDDMLFRDVHSNRVAGAVISVYGNLLKGSEKGVTRQATNVTVENCTLIDSGKFMWDYGLLWQIMIWPEDYKPEDLEMAKKYFRNDAVRTGLAMADGDTAVRFANTGSKPVKVSTTDEPAEQVCFFGDRLPRNIVKGKGYFVVESTPEFIKVSDTRGGSPVAFDGAAGPRAKLMYNMMAVYYGLFAPTGSGPGKGAFDLVGCKNVRVTGCKISALGDTMHIQRSENIVFASNHIIGSRMGAFFLAEYCKNSTITGNLIDGGNGSRVMSVEKSNEDVVIIGNTFRNGGRGSWINQPKNLILQDNIFVNNTTKGEPDPWRGRRSHQTGDYLKFPELYFTQYEPDGTYGPVIIKDNTFTTGKGASDAITFARGGFDVQVIANVFEGETNSIVVEDGVKNFHLHDNLKADPHKAKAGETSLMYHGRP